MGDKNKLNKIKGIVSPVMASAIEIDADNFTVPKGTVLFNTDTEELRIADGTGNPREAKDHKHYTYAPIAHSHMSSVNEPWLMSNPRLFYRNELVNHPELIALDGQDVDDAVAEYLSRVYPGTKLLTEPCMWSLADVAYGNQVYTLSATSSKEGYSINKITGTALDTSNILLTNDQWLMNGTDEVSITYSFKGNHQFVIDDYWLMVAAGDSTAAGIQRPSPRTWSLSITTDNTTWTEIDSHVDVEPSEWANFTFKSFKTGIKTPANKVKLTISAWNLVEGSTLEAGLRRFWMFGKRPDVFSLPLLETPSDDFVWVVPKNNLYVGMHHETVGDICYPSGLTDTTALNRIKANGASVSFVTYEELFAVIGHKYDTNITPIFASECSSTPVDETLAYQISKPVPEVVCVSVTVDDPNVAPNSVIIESVSNSPKHIVVETVLEDGTFSVIAEYTDFTQMENRVMFQIDEVKTVDKYRNLRFNILSWENEDAIDVSLSITTNVTGQFTLPTVPSIGNVDAHIVVSNVVTDISPEIIQRLQLNQIELSAVVAELINKVNTLDPNIGG